MLDMFIFVHHVQGVYVGCLLVGLSVSVCVSVIKMSVYMLTLTGQLMFMIRVYIVYT